MVKITEDKCKKLNEMGISAEWEWNSCKVDLSESNLRDSNLSWSDLRGSSLSWSDLSESNLSWSDLSESNLRHSVMRRANLEGAMIDKEMKDKIVWV